MYHGYIMDWKKNNFFQSGNFEQARKVRQYDPKYWKNEDILASFFSDFLIEVYFVR